MLGEIAVGVAPVTMFATAAVLVPARLLRTPPVAWRKAGILAAALSAIAGLIVFGILAQVFAGGLRPVDGVGVVAIAGAEGALVTAAIAWASRLVTGR